MKLKLLSMTVAAMTLSTQATAVSKFDAGVADKVDTQKQVQQLSKADFGMYKVEKGLALVPSSIAAADSVIASKGENAVVALEVPNDLVKPGSLVRNIFTGNLAPLSGNISILLKKGVSANDVAAATGLKLESSFSGTDLAVVSVAENQDVLKAQELLKASGLIKEARIEVLEARHTAR
ncbi:hypothetical protein AAEU29_08985 [Pseudoalteromonas sp. SSM20]|uniref:hypothetical protein n=1 Tax=Pseudoalteromonas sp. SSM20 TaxID=3139394 RepID=UPI003BA863F5